MGLIPFGLELKAVSAKALPPRKDSRPLLILHGEKVQGVPMSNPDYYVHIKSLTIETGDLLDWAYADAKKYFLCPGCLRPKPGVDELTRPYPKSQAQGTAELRQWMLHSAGSDFVPFETGRATGETRLMVGRCLRAGCRRIE